MSSSSSSSSSPPPSEERYTYTCPITHLVFRDPVVASDRFMYERAAIEVWIRAARGPRGVRSPQTNVPLANSILTPAAPAFLADLEQFVALHPEEERSPPPTDNTAYLVPAAPAEGRMLWYQSGRVFRDNDVLLYQQNTWWYVENARVNLVVQLHNNDVLQ
jgi:hypothetical protein